MVVLGVLCTAPLGAHAEDYTYQSLTNLGPCTSSRVLLMNNDTNTQCPIEGQGYADTNETTTAVGGTFWWHDGEAPPTGLPSFFVNLLTGANHVLYQKTDDAGGRKALWTLVDCRAGAGGYHAAASSTDNGKQNYLPWSKTCQPIDPVNFSAPLEDGPSGIGAANVGGIKQVAQISMRCTSSAVVYSPYYEDGIGEIYFDVVNGWSLVKPDSICVEKAIGIKDGLPGGFDDGRDWDDYLWEPVPCDMFVVEDLTNIHLPDENRGLEQLTLRTTKYWSKMYFRVRARLNYRGPIRFRIRRLSSNATTGTLDYNGLIYIDNIIASYPGVEAEVRSSGVKSVVLNDTDNRKNCKRADLGWVGAFTEPLLSVGLEGVKPTMSFSAMTNGQPEWIEAKATVSKADCAYRWRYLDQAFGPWKTNSSENISIIGGTNVVWDTAIDVTNLVGDIEYSYSAWVSGTRYRYFDFANDTKLAFPDDTAAEMYVQCATNYTARIRAGVSPWQELHVLTEVVTNESVWACVTNDWTMELTGDHSWRGFVDTRTNYLGRIAHIRIEGRNRFATAGATTPLASKTWYMPEIKRIPDGYKALTEIPEAGEYDLRLDCSTGYLVLDFNDESDTFTLNHAEYQDFNIWTPPPGTENKYVGDFVNTTYVGTAKQTYLMDSSGWTLSRTTSPWWWENFDAYAGNPDYPFNVPYGQNNLTPNGWTFDNGMYVNGFFTAVTNKTTYGMALQLQGRGAGAVALIDPADTPNGIGTISFSARLAQYLEFGDFFCYLGGFLDKNYAFSAKATMTHTPQDNNHPERNDISTGCPSISLVAYYRPGHGCYEVRVSRIWAKDKTTLWGKDNGALELAIYRWNVIKGADGKSRWTQKKLKSQRLGTGGTTSYDKGNFLAPVANSTTVDNDKWTSLFIAAYNTGSGTYVEGAISEDQVASYSGLSGDDLLKQAVLKDMGTSGRMFYVSVTDKEVVTNSVSPLKTTPLYHEKGTYGVCSTECPAAFGALNRHALTAAGPYYSNASKFTTQELQRDSLNDGDWGSTSPERMISWNDFELNYPDKESYIGVWDFGVCASPVFQELKLLSAPSGNSSDWTSTGLSLTLESYQPTNLVFSPHTLNAVNIKLSVGGTQADARTDVVVDDLQLSQWKGEKSEDSLDEMGEWAYTGGWLTTTTNDMYQGAGASTSDPVAKVSKCGFVSYKVEGTEDDYVYVFTNTVDGVYSGSAGGYATFIPTANVTLLGAFGLGGGGSGGAGGGGGGGGSAFVITNSTSFNIGEEVRVYVGTGGTSAGWNASRTGGTVRGYNASTFGNGNGGNNSYLRIRPLGSTSTSPVEYYAYGGGRGGAWRDGSGYAQGGNGTSSHGAGGGSGRYRDNNTSGAVTKNSSGYPAYGSGMGAGVTNIAESAGGGGGGGLVVYAGATSTPSGVLVQGGDGGHGRANNGVTETDGVAGIGGTGFKISDIPDAAIRQAITKVFGVSESQGLGGGGGGGGGTNTVGNAAYYGYGSTTRGRGRDGGSDGSEVATTYANAYGADDARNGLGGGGGGGQIHAVVYSGGNSARNWLTRGGRGGDGLVVLHVRVNNRAVLLQPMRGDPTEPMSVSTPLMDGISMLGFSWMWADANAEVHVQVNTNGVNESNIDGVRVGRALADDWVDVGVVKFSQMSAAAREAGSTNFAVGMRSPISGIARVLIATNTVNYARNNATNAAVSSMYGAVAITAMLAMDEPPLDDRSWWGWNIMPTDLRQYGSLYDHLYDTTLEIAPGRSCALNFSGQPGTGVDDPLFADTTAAAEYDKHDPFIQTPRFTNGIGQVTFLARMLETNGVSGWVTISGATDPEAEDEEWTAITNIRISAESPFYKPYLWRMPFENSDFSAVRLTAWAAKDGRESAASAYAPNKIQRVLLEEVTVMQPMTPGLAFAYPPRPYRYNGTKKGNPAPLSQEQILSPDEQPILNESFGMQVQLVPAGLEEELDRSSIRVFMDWYADESPWGYVNWKDPEKHTANTQSGFGIELVPAEGWSENNLIYHSSHADASGLIPPQLAADTGYRVVQYRISIKYSDKNGNTHESVMEVGSDWTEPPWYVFAAGNPYNQGSVKCAYTILDEISPKRAWINEINMYTKGDLNDTVHQYVEVAVPQGLSLNGWTMSYFEHGSTSTGGKYTSHPLVSFGAADVVEKKFEPTVSQYAFIAIQSPATKAAGTYNTAEHNYLNDGTWGNKLFNGDGVQNVLLPYAFRLLRPTGIVEHELVFMCTNTSTSRARYTYDGTNFVSEIKKSLNDDAWIYVGADDNASASEDYSLGVFTNHGENVSCWTNWMKQTPGNVNKLTNGTPQYIDPAYFNPPEGNHLWIYAEVDAASKNTVWVKSGEARMNTVTLIVPQNALTGTYSTNVTYEVLKWFDIKSVTTNLLGMAAVEVATSYDKDATGQWVLDLSNFTLPEGVSPKLFVKASTKPSKKIPDVEHGGLAPTDPYYAAVMDWLQDYEEGDIHLAHFYGMDNEPVKKNGEDVLLSLKEMYWLDIPPVSRHSDDWEWIFKAGMGGSSDHGASASGSSVYPQEKTVDGCVVTTVHVTVTMMISNRADSVADPPRPPSTLRGLEPGSTSSNSVAGAWNSATFKVQGMLQNGLVDNIWRPIRWFTLGPDSFGAADSSQPFSRTIEIPAPADVGYDWAGWPADKFFYRFSIDETLGPMTIYELNDQSAELYHPSSP